MKFLMVAIPSGHFLSLPVRGAWIEMMAIRVNTFSRKQSLPVRGAWIEIELMGKTVRVDASLPVRGAWIEIQSATMGNSLRGVAPRAGSVD